MLPLIRHRRLLAVAVSAMVAACAGPAHAALVPRELSGPPHSQRESAPRRLVQNRYYAKPGKGEEVYAWRLHASDVLRKLGLHAGVVLRGPGGEAPDAVWQVVLDSAELVQEGRVARENPEFQEVMRHMGSLIRRFEGGTYLERRLDVEPSDSGTVSRPSRPKPGSINQ